MTNQAWYTYPQDQPPGVYGSYPDPMGNYPKPDTNVCVPSGVPITALASGTVTGSQSNCLWCPSVTIKLDQPLNDIADHMAYNFLGSSTVHTGDTVQKGQIIGYAGNSKGVCTAFALTHDDIYGGSTFSQYVGSSALDPRPVLKAAIAGLPITPFTASNSSSGVGGIVSGVTSTVQSLLKDAAVFILALMLIVLGVLLLKDTGTGDRAGVEQHGM